MKTLMWRQLLLVLLMLSVLSWLFFNSRINTGQHNLNVTSLLQLKEQDAGLRYSLSRVAVGKIQSFDPLTRVQRQITHSLVQLQALQQGVDRFDHERIDLQLRHLSEKYQHEFQLIDRFKSDSAIMFLSLRYLPKLTRDLLIRIGQQPGDNGEMINLVNQLSREVLVFADQAENSRRLRRLLLRFSSLKQNNELPDALREALVQMERHSQIIAHYRVRLANNYKDIYANNVGGLIQQLFTQYQASHARLAERAGYYRGLLFAGALVLVVYLAYLFFRLQKLMVQVSTANTYLEFQQFALDEHAIVSITDVQGNITYANDRFCEVSQYRREELLGKNHRIIRSDEHDAEFFRQMWRTIANGEVWHGVICNKARDGSLYWVESTIVPHLNEQGKPFEYIGIRTEITDQVALEQEARKLARFPHESPEPVMRLGRDGTLQYANPASDPILDNWQVNVGQVVGRQWQALCVRLLETGKLENLELLVGRQTFLLTFTPIAELDYVNIYGRDITERKRAEEDLSYQATHDQLTGLRNRFYFERFVSDALQQIHQHDLQGVLIYIDLDQFKIVNDTCGHVAGDGLLRQLGSLLQDAVRETDVLARLGGDEFGLFLSHCDLTRGLSIAEKLHGVISEYRFIWEEKLFQVGASLGVVAVDKTSNSLVELMGAADVACYQAKDLGRNQIRVYQQDDESTARRKNEMQWATEIPSALRDNRFLLMGQEIKALQENDGHRHFEILLRMIDEEGSMIPPGAFIPAAERYNLMSSIDQWVVRNTVEFIHQHRQAGLLGTNVSFAINLSGESMARPELLQSVGELVRKYQLTDGVLSFEVTETSAISNLTQAVDFIGELKSLGCKFALDDFGSGLSSFAYLKSLPVDYLKIDGAFVRDMLDDPIDLAMVRSINQIGHVMQIRTIAEFAENEAVVNRLREIGVDYAQGYGVAMPRPLDEIFSATPLTANGSRLE